MIVIIGIVIAIIILINYEWAAILFGSENHWRKYNDMVFDVLCPSLRPGVSISETSMTGSVPVLKAIMHKKIFKFHGP